MAPSSAAAAGIIVLKRLADALANGDTIHAVIKGSAVNNDGSEKAGYTAPSVNSQADAVVEALANAGIDAESITISKRTVQELRSAIQSKLRRLTKAFRISLSDRLLRHRFGENEYRPLDAAAGIAGIIKTVLALNIGCCRRVCITVAQSGN